MGLQRGQIGYWGKGSQQCYLSLACPKHSGLSVWLHLFMFWIIVPHLLCKVLHHMSFGMERNLGLIICGSGGVWLMCIFKGIKEQSLIHIWKSVFSLDILRAIRVGSSTIQKQRNIRIMQVMLRKRVDPSWV